MKLVFSRRALHQLDDILEYIAARQPAGADHVRARIKTVIDLLLDHPMAGSGTGHRDGRRIVANPYPYAIFYRIRGSEVLIQRIRHTSRRPL